MRKLFVPSAFVSIVLMTLLLSAADKTTSSKTTLPAATDSSLPAPARAAMNSIDPERIRAHVRFLADDLLEGRGTGQRGGDIAAQYIATQFALYGLKPAGDNGTYLQKVPMVGITPSPDTTFSLVPETGTRMALKVLDDYVC